LPRDVSQVFGHPKYYLVVEDDRVLARVLSRFLGSAWIEHTVRGAIACIEQEREALLGLIVDVRLPDGSGIEFLARARQLGVSAPALVLTSLEDREIIAAAQLHGAFFLPKPPREENLRAFVEQTQRSVPQSRAELDAEVNACARRLGLTPREREILLLAASGVQRSDIAESLGVEECTAKTLVRRLLRKAGHSTLGDVVSDIHRNVFLDWTA